MKYPIAKARGFYRAVALWATSWPGNVVTSTTGECDLDSMVSDGTSENTFVLLPKGTLYLGTPKHDSLFKVQHVDYSIALLLERSKAASIPCAEARGFTRPLIKRKRREQRP